MKSPNTLRAFALLAALSLSGAISACASAPQRAEAGVVRLDVAPIATNAAYVLGVKKGFFSAEGIEVKINTATANGVPGSLASMQSGAVDVATAATSPVLLAASKGLPITILAAQTSVLDSPAGLDGDTVLMVRKNSPIGSVQDLAGKKIAVNELTAQAELMARAAIDQNGGHSDRSTFVPIPFPAMVAALTSGRVDAVFAVEPLVSQAKAAGARVLVNCDTVMPGAQLTTAYTTKDFADKNPQVVKDLISAMNKSSAYANQHPDEVRQVLSSYTRMPPALAGAIRLPHFSSETSEAATKREIDLMVKYRFIDKPVDLAAFQYKG